MNTKPTFSDARYTPGRIRTFAPVSTERERALNGAVAQGLRYLVVGGLDEVGAAKGIGQGGAWLLRTPAARTPGRVGSSSPLIDVHLTHAQDKMRIV